MCVEKDILVGTLRLWPTDELQDLVDELSRELRIKRAAERRRTFLKEVSSAARGKRPRSIHPFLQASKEVRM